MRFLLSRFDAQVEAIFNVVARLLQNSGSDLECMGVHGGHFWIAPLIHGEAGFCEDCGLRRGGTIGWLNRLTVEPLKRRLSPLPTKATARGDSRPTGEKAWARGDCRPTGEKAWAGGDSRPPCHRVVECTKHTPKPADNSPDFGFLGRLFCGKRCRCAKAKRWKPG